MNYEKYSTTQRRSSLRYKIVAVVCTLSMIAFAYIPAFLEGWITGSLKRMLNAILIETVIVAVLVFFLWSTRVIDKENDKCK